MTGGGSGIGRAIAHTFARHGAHVAILERDADAGRAAVAEIERDGGRATCHVTDVTDLAAVEEALGATHRQTGRLDVLVNNAGVSHVGTVESTTPEDFTRVFDVNVRGVYHGLKAAVPLMKAQGGGVILNLASIVSVMGIPDRFAYSMSKGAVLTMTYSVARDYVSDGIRCNAVGPGRVHTPFVDDFIARNYPGQEKEMFGKLAATQPIGRMGEPDEIAHLALYLCSDAAGFITGSYFPIDGGFEKLKM